MVNVNLIFALVVLLFFFIALVWLYVWNSRGRKSMQEPPAAIETFESLSAAIADPSTDSAHLAHAAEMIVAHFGKMNAKTLPIYQNLLEMLCVHPHTDSKIILHFEKGLRLANPSYTDSIEHALSLGLAARG